MGCDIHVIVEIKQSGKWKFVEDVPNSILGRNYHLFGFLANVRNSFDADGFEAKGLPEDISGLKFNFESLTPEILKRYESGTTRRCETSWGELIDIYDDRLKRKITKEEYDEFQKQERNPDRYSTLTQSWDGEKYQYTICDAEMVGGRFVDVPLNIVYETIEDFKKTYEDDWDEQAQDYGSWDIDFVDKEWHSHSYLTLEELIKKDKTDYLSTKYKMSKAFYDKFIESGGVFPENFVIKEKRSDCGTIIDAFSEAFNPTVMCSWRDEEKEKENPLIKGISELKDIAEKHSITNYEDIRIVFAFDC